MGDFTYHGTSFDYFDHEYNATRRNERAVEVPIASAFVDAQHGDGLEVGNVLSHYRPVRHRVIDRWERAPGVLRADVLRYDEPADWIVSVSTLEHVRWDEPRRDRDGAIRAMFHLLGLLRPNGRMLVTIPFGWHPYLDSAILDGRFPTSRECTFVRDGAGWVQTAEVTHKRYAASTRWAESVWVGEFGT